MTVRLNYDFISGTLAALDARIYGLIGVVLQTQTDLI